MTIIRAAVAAALLLATPMAAHADADYYIPAPSMCPLNGYQFLYEQEKHGIPFVKPENYPNYSLCRKLESDLGACLITIPVSDPNPPGNIYRPLSPQEIDAARIAKCKPLVEGWASTQVSVDEHRCVGETNATSLKANGCKYKITRLALFKGSWPQALRDADAYFDWAYAYFKWASGSAP